MDIKVCGIGIVSALGIGCVENYQALLSGRCAIGENNLFESSIKVPVGQLRKSNEQLKELLGLSQTDIISRTALLGAIAAKEALSNVELSGKRLGIINSTSVGGMDLSEEMYKDFMQDNTAGDINKFSGHDCASSTEFIAQMCHIKGFQTTISTACSSAANAVIMGAQMLKSNMLDYVLVGGTDALCRFTLNGFNSLKILDSQLCRPLDEQREGLNLGEGAAYLLLTKDPEASSLCTLVGYANANDAHHQTATSEQGDGAFLAMSEALTMAQISIDDIDYINLHGTGTNNNDSSELAALERLSPDKTRLACSSTKSYTGHTLAAAGGIEAVFSVLSILHSTIFANLRLTKPILEGSCLITESKTDIDIKYVLSSSFGFGGNCSTLIFSR